MSVLLLDQYYTRTRSTPALQFRQRIPSFSYFGVRRQNSCWGGSASDQVRLHLQRFREVKRPSSGAKRGLRDAETHNNSGLENPSLNLHIWRGSFYWGHYLYNSSLDAHRLLRTSASQPSLNIMTHGEIRHASFGAVFFLFLFFIRCEILRWAIWAGPLFNFSTSIIFTQRRPTLRPYVVFRCFFHLTKRKRARPPTQLERNPIFQTTPLPIWL